MKRNLRTIGIALFSMLLMVSLNNLAEAVSCGDTIGPGGTFTLTSNLNCSDNPALTVGGPVIIDLNGYIVECQSNLNDGIIVQGKAAQVKNGTVQGCSNGIIVEGVGSHQLRNLNARSNDLGFLVNSNNNRLYDNTSTTSGALFSVFGNKNRFIDNTACNADKGFLIEGNNNRLYLNTINDTKTDSVTVLGNNNQIIENTITNSEKGISVVGDNNQITDNTASDIGPEEGFSIWGNNNLLKRNISNNGVTGIQVQLDSQNNTIRDNVAIGNSLDLEDENANCDNNAWRRNIFGTSKPVDCIR